MLLGFHHVTALAADAQANLDFYAQRLQLHLVKRTVNFDEPAAHHLYFGDRKGTPGTLLTLFPGFHRPAIAGSGQIVSVSFATPAAAAENPDGLGLEIVASQSRRLESITLCERELEPTARCLGLLGFEPEGAEGNVHSFVLPDRAARVNIRHEPQAGRGKNGVGGFDHVAFRVADEAAQLDWRNRLVQAGVRVSPVKDRLYFHSIYFREPGGALFELATDGPGFLVDEPEDRLGSSLRLPPWLEPIRDRIETLLTPLTDFAQTLS
jgi:glyoxalase family protein